MKTIVVDDEPLALTHLAEEIERFSDIRVIGKYRNPKTALDAICTQLPDVVFLDIEMPEMSGVELAERILTVLPHMKIVFVTVYDAFAIQAFEMDALDYILKPVSEERLQKTLARLKLSNEAAPPSAALSHSVKVHCFKSLQFERGGKEPAALRWKTFKAQELFIYLLYNCGQPVRKQLIIADLWGDIDGKRGVTQLYTAIYQIRKLLQAEEIPIQILNVDEGYMLDLQGTVLDYKQWENERQLLPDLTCETLKQHIAVFSLYRGDLLDEYKYIWSEAEKIRLRNSWLQHARLIVAFYDAHEQITGSITVYLRVQQILPTEEGVYFELMQLYDRLGDRFAVEKQYELLHGMLNKELALKPQAEVKSWFQDWRRKGFAE